MAKHTLYCFLAGVFIALGSSNASAGDTNWKNISAEYTGINCVLIAPNNPREIYAGSEKAILKSEDSGGSWRVVLNVKKPVNYLVYSAQDNSIYAASGRGLYYSGNQGRNWKLIFKISDYPDNEAVFVLLNCGAIYLGTKNGLLVSEDKGRSWHKYAGKLSESRIFSIACGQKGGENIYIASEDGFFASYNNGQSWEKIFNDYIFEENQENQDNNDDAEKETALNINYIITASDNSGVVYLSCKRGIYKSVDCGRQWELLPDFGLLDRYIKFMLVSADSTLYAVTKTGIYKFTATRWQELSLGLASQEIRFLALDGKGNLYTACDRGVFKAIEESSSRVKNKALTFYYKGEPDISQIQKAAIKYAEVEPEKIQLWRKQAAKKALLPKISASVDRDTSDIWHWESGSSTKASDDALIKGNDSIDWGVTVSWDLGEIIWNNDQTSIDTRSRLMVQLREDVLDEVTKLYFERIRLKMELDNLSIEDRKKRFEKELKIRELTAMLDGMTGGYFSQASQNRCGAK
ncbi:MAG: hypothetical protein ABIH18_05225 [Candidatus Omnitrophota bacterium]